VVCGTTWKVHVIVPLDGGGASGSPGFTWIVTFPCHVPTRNDVGVEGPIGFGDAAAGRRSDHHDGRHPCSRVKRTNVHRAIEACEAAPV
jgi:hypothetical protein